MVSYKKNTNKINKSNTKQVAKKTANKFSSKPFVQNGCYYSFFTIILILCLIQISISTVINLSKCLAYRAKIAQITKTRDDAKALNEQLNENIKNFSNITGLEEIARNNLKMSSADEVLVIINTNKNEEETPKHLLNFMKR